MNHLTKRTFFTIILMVFMACIPFSSPTGLAADNQDKSGEKEHEKIIEEVTVTNVQVPVRVIYKGQPVTDLKIEDFTLYEDKKKVKINDFFLKRKTITVPTASLPSSEVGEAAAKPVSNIPPRTFVIVFNLVNYNEYFQKAMDHLFDKFLKPNDRLLILANNTTREYKVLTDKAAVKTQVVDVLKKESKLANRKLYNYIKQVENTLKSDPFHRLNFTNLGQLKEEAPAKIIRYLGKYLEIWRQYKMTYLTPDMDKFYYFSRYLENTKTEKWVLNFYQFELFPRIRINSRTMGKLQDFSEVMRHSAKPSILAQSKVIDQLLQKVIFEVDMAKSFPNQEISKLFYKVDATFHSFFIRSSNTAFLQDIEYRQVSSDVEQVLKRITDITGGDNITSNDLVASLETVSKREDVYYMLTYAPKNPKNAGRLKVKVNNKKYKVYYDDNFHADYINEYLAKLEQKIQTPDVKIEGFSFKEKILAFTVRDFLIRTIEGKTFGQMQVRIRLIGENKQSLFDQTKTLRAEKDFVSLSLPMFKNIKKGQYGFMIDVNDMMTGKEVNLSQNVVVKR
ncbi:MAG: hypothetical protein GY940_21245 [bacterium]|nr:hypothetical protein [bacterium]